MSFKVINVDISEKLVASACYLRQWNEVNWKRLWDWPLKSSFSAKNFMRLLSWSISSHFGAIHSWNVCRRPKSQKIHYNPLF